MFCRSPRRVLVKAIRRAYTYASPYKVEDADFAALPEEKRAAARSYLEAAGYIAADGMILPAGFALAAKPFAARYPVVVLAALLTIFFVASTAFEIWFTRTLVQEGSALPFDGPGCEDEDDYPEDGFESPI